MYAWVPMQMFWNGWHRAFSRLHLWIENLPNGKATNRKKKMCWRKAVRMAERSKAPDARNCFFEKSDTRVWARVRSPLLSENISDVMGHQIQLTNSLILKYVWVQTQIRSGKSFEMYDNNCAADYISELKKLKKEIAQLKSIMADAPQAGKAQRSNAPDCRISLVERSGTPVCAWVRIPILSENVLNTMRHSLQLTNSVILQRQFKMTAQSKILQKTRNVIRGWQPSGLKIHKKEDTQQRHVKHDSTRRFDRKSFQMDDANRLADYSSELKNLPNWKSTYHTKKSRG